MAPTELLAEQHMESFLNWFGPLKINVIKLTGGQKKTIRTEILSQIENGKIDLIIGTHALFQDGVVFKNLSLIVIDEQHRFGVNQRVALRRKVRH
jgi:ATP-dependent DNA helicase RecG